MKTAVNHSVITNNIQINILTNADYSDLYNYDEFCANIASHPINVEIRPLILNTLQIMPTLIQDQFTRRGVDLNHYDLDIKILATLKSKVLIVPDNPENPLNAD